MLYVMFWVLNEYWIYLHNIKENKAVFFNIAYGISLYLSNF